MRRVRRSPASWLAVAAAVLVPAAVGSVAAATAGAAPPSITAPAAAVIEASTGTVLYAKSGNAQRGMASTTKLMTALVALDEEPLTTQLRAVDYPATPSETRLGLQPGERMTVADLVRAMMLPSANDAAQTIAVRSAGNRARFVDQMNRKARELGLTRTHFTNPVGLDAPTHRTTAIELARIGVAAHANPFLRATVKRPRITLASGALTRTITNRNLVLGTSVGGGGRIDGMKTGHTNASGYTLVGSATRGGVTIVSAVLGDPSEAARDADTVRLLRWGSRLMIRRTLVRGGEPVASVPVLHGTADRVVAAAPRALRRVVARGAKVRLVPASVAVSVEAPIRAGQRLGTADVLVNGRRVDTVPVAAAAAIEREGPLAAAVGWIGDHFLPLLLSLALVLGGTLTIARSRRPRPAAPAAGGSTRPQRTPTP